MLWYKWLNVFFVRAPLLRSYNNSHVALLTHEREAIFMINCSRWYCEKIRTKRTLNCSVFVFQMTFTFHAHDMQWTAERVKVNTTWSSQPYWLCTQCVIYKKRYEWEEVLLFNAIIYLWIMWNLYIPCSLAALSPLYQIVACLFQCFFVMLLALQNIGKLCLIFETGWGMMSRLQLNEMYIS